MLFPKFSVGQIVEVKIERENQYPLYLKGRITGIAGKNGVFKYLVAGWCDITHFENFYNESQLKEFETVSQSTLAKLGNDLHMDEKRDIPLPAPLDIMETLMGHYTANQLTQALAELFENWAKLPAPVSATEYNSNTARQLRQLQI